MIALEVAKSSGLEVLPSEIVSSRAQSCPWCWGGGEDGQSSSSLGIHPYNIFLSIIIAVHKVSLTGMYKDQPTPCV